MTDITHQARGSAVLRTCLSALACIIVSSAAYASPQPPEAKNVHFCLPLDIEEMRSRDSIYAASKQALNLNVGPPRTVRMIYFLPNDRPFRASVVDSMKKAIRQIQTFYGEQMQAHGYGYKTFAVESDASGEPIVHRLDGQYPDSHYLYDTFLTVPDEVKQVFDLDANIYVIVVDNSINAIGIRGRQVAGTGGSMGKIGGKALVHGAFSFFTAAHELGHAFGLKHDFRDNAYIMSYGGGIRGTLSACNAEFLATHPILNSSVKTQMGSPPTIILISKTGYPAGSRSVSVRLNVSDSDGLHQVVLFVRTPEPHLAAGFLEVKACRRLGGETNAVVEFDYDGVVPSNGGTSLSNPNAHQLDVRAVDTDGNVRRRVYFNLWEVSPQLITTLEYKRPVLSVDYSSDGETLAVALHDSTVRLWNSVSRRDIATLRHMDSVGPVVFSPTGQTLAVGSGDRTVKLWDVATRRVFASLGSHRYGVTAVAFSSDGMALASGSSREVRLWDVATQRNFSTLAHSHSVESVAFSPDGKILATGSWGGTSSSDAAAVRLWNVNTGQIVATLEGHEGRVTSVAFSPDGKTLASGSDDETIKLWDVETRTNVGTFEGHQSWVRSVAFSPDGKTLASGSESSTVGSLDNAVKLWDFATRRTIATYRHTHGQFGKAHAIHAVTFSPDGMTVASGGWLNPKVDTYEATVMLWNVSEWTRPRPQTIEIISGDNQRSSVGSELANPFVVEVRDQNGNPLPDVQVQFAVTEGNGKLSGKFNIQNTTTNATGRAQIPPTLGPDPGTNVVEVTVDGIVARIQEKFNAEGVGTPTVDRDYRKWHLPDGAFVRLGKGSISRRDRAVAFSPDGHVLAVASGIGVWLYDIATQRELALLTGHQGGVNSVVFSADGTMLVSGSSSGFSGTLKLWDVATGRNIATFGGNRTWRQAIMSVAFSPDGNSIAAGSYGEVGLWDVGSKTKLATLKGHTRWVLSLAYSPDGKMLASGLNDNKVELWDIAARTKTTLTPEGSDASVAFSPDGTILASAGAGIVKLWDVETQTVVNTLRKTYGPVAFSPDGTMLFAGDNLWDVKTTTIHATFDVRAGSVAFSPNGATLATVDHSEVRLWDIQTRNYVTIEHSAEVRSVAFSPDGRTLASGEWAKVRLWDVGKQTNVATLNGGGPVLFFPDGATLVTGNYLWSVPTRTNFAIFSDIFLSVAISPDGTTLASGGTGSTIKLWDAATRQNIGTLEGHTGDINDVVVQAVAFSPDGMTLASGSTDKTIKLWNVATRRNIATLRGHSKSVESVAFSPDGETLASGSRDRTCKLWNVASKQTIATLWHRTEVLSVVFAPDGNTLVSGSADGDVLVWDPVSKDNINTLNGHTGWVRSVAFSPNGTTFASGATDGTVLLWDTSALGLGASPEVAFSLFLDGNIAAGDQSVTTLDVNPGSVVPIQLFGNDIRGVNGVSVRFEYDAAQVGYDGFDPGVVLPNAQVLAVPATNPNAIDISVVSFGGQAAVDSGMVGSIRFQTTDVFSGTTLRMVSAEIGRGDKRESITPSDVSVMLRLAKPTPDFNGDGKVDFGDFVAFGMHFGASRGDARYDAKYDLDQDGMIGFGDFLIFGQEFGT